jgi:hypothetical protein
MKPSRWAKLVRNPETKWFLISAIVPGIFLSLGAVLWLLRPAELDYDAKDLCNKRGLLHGHTVLVIDKTDKWTEPQASDVKAEIFRVAGAIGKFEKLSVYFLDSTAAGFNRVFSICNPGNPKEWPWYYGIYRGFAVSRAEFVQRYERPIREKIPALTEPNESTHSKISEAITHIVHQDDFKAELTHRSLFLISDMRQNSDGFSFYRAGEAENAEALLDSESCGLLSGTSARVFFVPHPKGANVKESTVRDAWRDSFSNCNTEMTWQSLGS